MACQPCLPWSKTVGFANLLFVCSADAFLAVYSTTDVNTARSSHATTSARSARGARSSRQHSIAMSSKRRTHNAQDEEDEQTKAAAPALPAHAIACRNEDHDLASSRVPHTLSPAQVRPVFLVYRRLISLAIPEAS